MKKLFFRGLSLALVLVMVLALFAACGGPDKPDTPDDPLANAVMVDDGNTYADPSIFPVVKTPITLEAAIFDNGTYGDLEAKTLWNEIAELTGVTYDLRILSASGESVNLLFAGKDYPDVSFRLDNQLAIIEEAANQGDIVELTSEMLESYAPNWYNIFANDPDLYNISVHADGKLYGLPNISYEAHAIDLRDCAFINADWLDELAMDVPTTTDEFLDYLRAVKNSAGVGSIPSNVIPLYIRTTHNVGGYLTILDWFGVYQGTNSDVVMSDGTVVSNLRDKNLIHAMNYMNQLYTEGLIEKDFYSNNASAWNRFLSITQPEDGNIIAGAFFAYDCVEEYITAMPALKNNVGAPSYMRDMGLDNRVLKDNFIIFKNCLQPIAALRSMDAYVTPENAVRTYYGAKDVYYKFTEDGEYRRITEVSEEDQALYMGMVNSFPCYVPKDIVQQLFTDEIELGRGRVWAFYEMYQDALPTDRKIFPAAALNLLTSDEAAEANELKTNINRYASGMFTKWIRGLESPADAWDTFQNQINTMGLNRLLELEQKAYDAYADASAE